MACFAGSKACYLTILFLTSVKESTSFSQKKKKNIFVSPSLCLSDYQVIQHALVLACFLLIKLKEWLNEEET